MSMPPPPPPAPGNQPPQWQQPAPQWQQPPQQQSWPAAPQQWQAQPPAVEKVGSPFAWLALLCAIAVAVGSGMTWIDFPGNDDISGFGTEGDAKDGVITILLAIVAAILLLLGGLIKLRVLHIIAAVVIALAAVTGWVDVGDVNGDLADVFGVKVGIGLWIVAIGATVGTLFAIIAAVQTRKRPVGSY